MLLPDDFCFSQTSLRDFTECPRRFQLRYLLRQPWPAVRSASFLERERLLQRAVRFHRMIERHQSGVPAHVVFALVNDDPLLAEWWAAYLDYGFLHSLEGTRYSEHLLSARLDGYCFRAKYDLIIAQGAPLNRLWIFDWKTGSVLSSRELLSSLQTRLYVCLVLAVYSSFGLGSLFVSDVSMVYWFSSFPSEPVVLSFSVEDVELFRREVLGVVSSIGAELDWVLTSDTRLCRFCVFATLCDRFSGDAGFEGVDDLVDGFLDFGFVVSEGF